MIPPEKRTREERSVDFVETEIPILPPSYEDIKDVIVWRCISMRTMSGGMSGFPHTEYMYDDYVLTTSLGAYLQEITNRGNVTKVNLHRIGPFSSSLGSERKQRAGTESIAKQRKNAKLEMFGVIT